jgi:thiol-disulfide isomerase/thioredoxin
MFLIEAGVEDVEQKLETFLKEIYTDEVFRTLTKGSGIPGTIYELYTFASRPSYYKKIATVEATPENFEKIKSDMKADIKRDRFAVFDAIPFWLRVADQHHVSAKQFINELIEFIQSPECMPNNSEKESNARTLKFILRFLPGTDLKLNGKTLDNKDFNSESLRGKYVWVNFTATWCGPCNLAIPGMLETYERYHDKGLEIVSIYVSQNEQNPVATVQKHVEEKKIPWIILSEELSKQAGQPEYWDKYCPRGVPTMLLVDKGGKIVMLPTHESGVVIAKLAEIFE